MEELQEH